MNHHPPDLPERTVTPAELADEAAHFAQARTDGSVPVVKHCYECGASSLTVLLDPICRANVHTCGVEYRYACRELTECAFRKAGLLVPDTAQAADLPVVFIEVAK